MALRPVLRVTAALGALAGATWMPDGRHHPEECVHRLDEAHAVSSEPGGGDVLTNLRTGERSVLPPCPAAAQRMGREGRSQANYYSDWIVNVVSVHPSIGRMTSNWTVPPAPKSRGPLPGMSSVYLFNGLEDGGGHEGAATVILQPVLSFGKSGCILNPLAGWEFTSFQVTQSGRAYCGPHISVEEGDALQGVMEIVETSPGSTTWNVVSDAGPRGRSEHRASFPAAHRFNAAYLTLEGMVIYACDALPGTGTDFTANALATPDGSQIAPAWNAEVRHSECKPSTVVRADGDVSLTWKSGHSAEQVAIAELVV